jgi:hypothetical protein
MVRTAVKAEEGPEQQTDSSSVRQKINSLRTAAPAMDNKVPTALKMMILDDDDADDDGI